MNPTKDKLLSAAESHFLDKGYCATTVDDICRAAGTTKGAFFHHFDNKLSVAVEALERHAARRFDAFLGWPAARATSAKDRVLAYLDGMTSMACAVERPACLVATMTLELSDVEPSVQAQCRSAFDRWTGDLTRLLDEACAEATAAPAPAPEVLAHHVMSSFQGALLIARAKRQPEVISDVMGCLREYVEAKLS